MSAPFKLIIATPDGSVYDGEATRFIARGASGDFCIMAKHANYVTSLGMGMAKVELEDGTSKIAACMGGMLTVMNGECRVVATTWEWKEDIDLDRAELAKNRAEERLNQKDKLNDHDLAIAEAKLKRALIRTGVAKL